MKQQDKQYSIRKNGRIYAQSDEADCGYSKAILRSMASAGYFLFQDGKQISPERRK